MSQSGQITIAAAGTAQQGPATSGQIIAVKALVGKPLSATPALSTLATTPPPMLPARTVLNWLQAKGLP